MTPLQTAILETLSRDIRYPMAAWEIEHELGPVRKARGDEPIVAMPAEIDAALEELLAMGEASHDDEGWRRTPERITAATMPQGVLF